MTQYKIPDRVIEPIDIKTYKILKGMKNDNFIDKAKISYYTITFFKVNSIISILTEYSKFKKEEIKLFMDLDHDNGIFSVTSDLSIIQKDYINNFNRFKTIYKNIEDNTNTFFDLIFFEDDLEKNTKSEIYIMKNTIDGENNISNVYKYNSENKEWSLDTNITKKYNEGLSQDNIYRIRLEESRLEDEEKIL